jgi:hypothetical protein
MAGVRAHISRSFGKGAQTKLKNLEAFATLEIL